MAVRDYIKMVFMNILEIKSNDVRFFKLKNDIEESLKNYDNDTDIDILKNYHSFFDEGKKIESNFSGAYRYLYDLDAVFLYKELIENKVKRGAAARARHADIMVSLKNIEKYVPKEEINNKYSKWIENYCLSGNIIIMPSYKQKMESKH